MREILPDSTALRVTPTKRLNPACPINTLGQENGRFFLEHSVVVKDRPACAGPPGEIFEAQNAASVFDAASSSVSGDGHTAALANQI